MATLSVIARPGIISTDTTNITMHAVPQETHSLANEITDHPVEEGFNASDHSRPQTDRVTFEARISNTPLSTSQATEAVKSQGFTFQTTTAAADAAGAIGAVDGYAQGQWEKLKTLRENGTIVKVSTTLGDYSSMAIENISATRTAKNYDGLAFTISFKLIRVVQNKLTRDVQSTDTRVGKKKSAGNKTPKPAADQDLDPLRPTLAGLKAVGNAVLRGTGNATN
jgi:hypothetical protein